MSILLSTIMAVAALAPLPEGLASPPPGLSRPTAAKGCCPTAQPSVQPPLLAYRITIAVPEGTWEGVLAADQPSIVVNIEGPHYPKRFKISRQENPAIQRSVEVAYLNSVGIEVVQDTHTKTAVEFPVVSEISQTWAVDGPTEGDIREAHIRVLPADK